MHARGLLAWKLLSTRMRVQLLPTFAASAVLGSAAPPAEPLLVRAVASGTPAPLSTEEPGRRNSAAEEPNARD
jgi:hypothetical protein